MQELELIKMQGDMQGMTRPLWEEIFSEDTERFLDYYYTEKAPEAWVYVLRKDGQIVSMLHLNPYAVYCGGAIRQSYYIVAVATKAEYRHRGCMRRLLQEAICDVREWGCPFLFLMPADPKIYEPFGFRYVYTHQSYVPTDAFVPVTGEQVDWKALAEFANAELGKRYRTFCVHDEAYFKRLQKELQSENGDLMVLYADSPEGAVISGYVCYANEGGKEAYQEVVLSKEVQDLFVADAKREAIMALSLQEKEPEGPCYFPEIV